MLREWSRFRGPWQVHTTGWMYALYVGDQETLLEHHLHPISNWHEKRPHIHFYAGDRRIHYPTGRIMIEDVLACAVQYGAEPRSEER